MLLCRTWPLPCKTQCAAATLRCGGLTNTFINLYRNVPDAFASTQAHLRITFSPEAYLLTDSTNNIILLNEIIKKRVKARQGARLGVWPCEVAAISLT